MSCYLQSSWHGKHCVCEKQSSRPPKIICARIHIFVILHVYCWSALTSFLLFNHFLYFLNFPPSSLSLISDWIFWIANTSFAFYTDFVVFIISWFFFSTCENISLRKNVLVASKMFLSLSKLIAWKRFFFPIYFLLLIVLSGGQEKRSFLFFTVLRTQGLAEKAGTIRGGHWNAEARHGEKRQQEKARQYSNLQVTNASQCLGSITQTRSPIVILAGFVNKSSPPLHYYIWDSNWRLESAGFRFSL